MSNTNVRFLLLSLVVAVAAGLLFTPGLPSEMVFDDIPSIAINQAFPLTQLDVDALAELRTGNRPDLVERVEGSVTRQQLTTKQ